jgi:LAO/AO transport system kinase
MLADRHIKPAAPAIDADKLAASIMDGERAALARGITLVESRKAEHRALADGLLGAVHARTGKAYRIGITGLPGVGKSTFIDQFGLNLADAGHRVAVLAVDPSSSRSGGSILGDKTRMGRLAHHANAYIRPSPSGGTLGGVTRATRETMLLCEAAGFDVVIVETVGVGQSEAAVAGMVDFFLVLLLPGAGDELQGIKKGLLELADMIAINKADGDLASQATSTAADYKAALHILTAPDADWQPDVVAISARDNQGLHDVWAAVGKHRAVLQASGAFAAKRRDQAVTWMQSLIEDRLLRFLQDNEAVRERLAKVEAEVRAGRKLPAIAAEEVLGLAGLNNAGPADGSDGDAGS